MSLMVLLVLKFIPYNSPSEVILLYYDYPHLQRRKLRLREVKEFASSRGRCGFVGRMYMQF